MNLEQWHIETIKQAFKSSYGLKDCLTKQLPQSIETLAKRTGMNVKFIKSNLSLILKIT